MGHATWVAGQPSVSAAKGRETGWEFSAYLDAAALLYSLDDIASAVEARTGESTVWIRRTGRTVSLSFSASASYEGAFQLRQQLLATGLFVDVRASNDQLRANALKLKDAPNANSAVAVGYIAKLAQGSGGLTPEQLRQTQAALSSVVQVVPISDDLISIRVNSLLTSGQVEMGAAALMATTFFEWVEPDLMLEKQSATPNDPYFSKQWNLASTGAGIHALQAWDISTGTPSVVVAVIDSGILTGHPEFVGRLVSGYDFISDPASARDGDGRDPNPQDEGTWTEAGQCGSAVFVPSEWHGSHVAGIIGAAANDGRGIAGIAWNVKIQPIRVMGACGSGATSDILAGMRWAAGLSVQGVPPNPTPARVLNMSIGTTSPSSQCSTAYQSVIDEVNGTGAIIVVAAGNQGDTGIGEAGFYQPSGCMGVGSVAATGPTGDRAGYSDYSLSFHVALSAPGGDMSSSFGAEGGILSTVDGGARTPSVSGLKYLQGTSMAAPHVSGAIALMLSARPTLNLGQVVTALLETTQDFNPSSTCYLKALCGIGILNAHAALVRATAEPAAPITTVQLTSNANPLAAGQTLTLIAQTTPASATGTMSFLVAGEPITGCMNLPMVSARAGCQITGIPASAGAYTFSAFYSGDYTHHRAISPELAQYVSGGGSSGGQGIKVVEYYNANFNHYFITPNAGEIALLGKPPFQDWQPTGQTFNAYPPASAPSGSIAVCRFYNDHFKGISTHFYAPKGLGCEAVLSGFPDWTLEDDRLFYAKLPDGAGNCPAGQIPVYRLYNNGIGGAPNHRFTTSAAVRQQMISQGYAPEGAGIGVGWCAPQ